jgi:ABC-2 type transport system ATP-binding protein
MLRGGVRVDRGSPSALISRYGRANMEQVFLDVARQRPERAEEDEETG